MLEKPAGWEADFVSPMSDRQQVCPVSSGVLSSNLRRSMVDMDSFSCETSSSEAPRA